ncbi:MAG: hypothetical protein RLZZ344_368 [Pseudomonadota bacterium]|jgi:hypothetical protein
MLGRDGVATLGHLSLVQHRRLVGGKCGALIEPAANLAIQLGDGPAAAQCLRFVEGAGLRALDGEQAHIGRPRQREGLGQGGTCSNVKVALC